MGQAKLKLEIKTFEEYVYYLCVSNNKVTSVFHGVDEEGDDILQIFTKINGEDILFEINEDLQKNFIQIITKEYGSDFESKILNTVLR